LSVLLSCTVENMLTFCLLQSAAPSPAPSPVSPISATTLFGSYTLSGAQLCYAQSTIQLFARFEDVAPFIRLVYPVALIISMLSLRRYIYPLLNTNLQYPQNRDTRKSLLQSRVINNSIHTLARIPGVLCHSHQGDSTEDKFACCLPQRPFE